MCKPNFFIVGAAKCGTTALSEYLRTHPDVFFSDPKEPGHFHDDVRDIDEPYKNREDYLALFKGASGYKAVGEASAGYLFSETAIPNILEFNPNAKIIVMLRNPVDMFQSLFYQQKYNMSENARDPEEAWRLQKDRKLGKSIPFNCPDPSLLYYSDWCSLGKQVEQVLEHASKNQVHFVVFDEFISDTRGEYLKVLEFLGIQDDGKVDFPKINSRTGNKSRFFQGVIRYLGVIKRYVGIKRSFNLLTKATDLNTKIVEKQTLTDDFARELADFFLSDIKKLEQAIQKDLSTWYSKY